MGKKTILDKGTVTMPLEAYNELFKELQQESSIIDIKQPYGSDQTYNVEINDTRLYEVARQRVMDNYSGQYDGYEFTTFEESNHYDHPILKKCKPIEAPETPHGVDTIE